MKKSLGIVALFALLLGVAQPTLAQRKTDVLDRGLVAIPANTNGGGSSGNFISWRIFAEEYYGVTYNLYANGTLLKDKLKVSNYTHSSGTASTKYQVAAVVNGVEQELSPEVTRWNNGYLDIPVAAVTDRNGAIVTSQYILNDISLGDVDGDGVTEFVVKRNYTGGVGNLSNTTCFHHYECYNIKGERLWWIDLGPNMLSGADEQWDIVLFDWDQDGKAEGLMRGADNMIIHTATGKTIVVGSSTVDTRWDGIEYTSTGSEYLLYLNGATGEPYNLSGNEEKPWIAYPLPRGNDSDWGTGIVGHRSTKHYFAAPFLDGRKASIFLGRGCYTKHHMKAFDVDPATHTLTQRWEWSATSGPWFGNGYHNFGIADVDEDGRDEIVFGSMVIDDNGKGLSTTALGHGDAQHCGDFDPYRKGLEFYACNESQPNCNYRNATTSKIYFRSKGTGDDGRGLMGNFTNNFPGCVGRSVNTGLISSVADKELSGSGVPATGGTNDGLYWSHLNFRIYWTGDLLEGILDSPGKERDAVVWTTTGGRVFQSSGCQMNNDSKNNPCATGDIFGDWREEIVLRADGNTKIRIYTTGISTNYRIPTLWHDHQYRNAMVWQPMGYNQPPHTSFFLGQLEGITVAPPPYTMTGRTEIANGGTISAANAGQHVIVCETNDTHITVEEGANPSVATFNVPSWVQGTNSTKTDGTGVINYTYYTCTVDGGAFTGGMTLAKQGDGILTLPNVEMTYTGETNVWAGTLNFDGSLLHSTLWLNRFAELNSDGGQFRSIKANYASVIRPGGADKQGSLTTDSLVLNFGSRLVLDAYSEGLQIDQVNIGLLSVEAKTGSVWENYGPEFLTPVVEVVPHTDESGKLANGKYLIGDITTIQGDLEKIKIIGLPTQKVSLSAEDGKLYLIVEGLRDAGVVYWTGAENTTWDFAKTENFQNIEGEKEIFVTGDKVIFDDAAKKFTVALSDDFVADSVIVDGAKAYTFNGMGALVGNTSLVKRGTGTLTIANDNTYTGKTLLSGGVVKVSTLSNENKAYGNLGACSTSDTRFVMENGATLQPTAAVQMGTPMRMKGDEGGVLNATSDFAMDSRIVGTTLTKKGTGCLICYQANTSLNRMVIAAGSVAERAGNAAKTVEFQGGTLYDDAQSTSHAIYVPKGKTGTWQLTGTYYTAYANKITGEGTLTIVPRNTVSRVRITGDWSQFEGTIKHTNTDIWLPLDCTSGLPKGTLNIASGCTVTNVCKAFTIGALTGSGSLAQPVANFQNSTAVNGNNTWNVGNSDGRDFTFAGKFTDNGSSNKVLFNKVGTCKMTFTGTGDFQGACKVNAGELCLNNSKTDIMLGTSALNVAKGAILSGKGTLGNASTTVAVGATIRSGIAEDNAAGNLRFSGKNLTVNGTMQTYIADATTYSKFTNIGTLRLNGTLVVRGAEDLALSVGDEIQLFDASTVTLGSDLVLDLCEPNRALGLTWDTSRLSEGILVVAPAPDAVMSITSRELDHAEIYTLTGVRLTRRPSRPGVYVVNGQKMMLKK